MAEEKKQVPLRLSPKLYAAIASWAEDDFRSINGQIEYLLTDLGFPPVPDRVVYRIPNGFRHTHVFQ